MDVQRIEAKLQQTENLFKAQEQVYQDKKAKYIVEKRKLEEFQTSKDKVSD